MEKTDKEYIMNYFKGILSGLAAIIVTELLTIWWTIRATHSKATGLDAIVAMLRESVFSPLVWSLAISFFTIFSSQANFAINS